MAYKEIVTKAVIAKGKKTYKNTYQIETDNEPSTILGCWIINHNFSATLKDNTIVVNGSYDANIWYSYDMDTKTTVINKKITYNETEKLSVPNSDITNASVIVRALKQPTCISAKEEGKIINIEIEKELGLEIVGDAKVKISSVEDNTDDWINLDDETKKDDAINNINPNYLNEEIIK